MPKRQLLPLTKKKIDDALPGSYVWDALVPGFGVRVYPSGKRSFIFQYRTRTGKQGKLQVGHYPAMTVENARKLARGYRAEVDSGKDPSNDRKAARSAPTMAELADYYCEQYARSRGLRLSTVRAARGLLDKFVVPRMGSRKVAEVQLAEIQRIHGDVQHHCGKTSANKFRAVLSRMFTLAGKLKWRIGNPATDLDKLSEDIRHTYLDREQLDRLLGACDKHPDQNAANAIRLLVFTGARLREVLNATWAQFDLDKGIWVKPSHHTKTKIRHQVVLAHPVVALLRSMRESPISTEFLFPGASLKAPRVDLKRPWTAICEDAGLSGYRIHDLRRTYATFMLSSGSDLSAVGNALGHTQASTTQRYASLLIDDQRDAANRAVDKMGRGLRAVA